MGLFPVFFTCETIANWEKPVDDIFGMLLKRHGDTCTIYPVSTMSNAAFWLALLPNDRVEDIDQRTRLWNGYLGWKLPSRIKEKREDDGSFPQWFIPPPEGGWPELTDEEKEVIESLAEQHGGHPEYGHEYMDFRCHVFEKRLDLSGLILTGANFEKVIFHGDVDLTKTRFYAQSWFNKAIFEKGLHCSRTWFEFDVHFDGSRFKESAWFINVEFMGGASFYDVVFEWGAKFDGSKFDETLFNRGLVPMSLANFRGVEFRSRTTFRDVLFGSNSTAYERPFPERKVDFTDAKFMTTTDFTRAVFWGPPAFFNTMFHEDTDFSRVDWKKADNDNLRVDYVIRAWERLELIMSKLEKPLDRHRFFRFKMRAQRRLDGPLLKSINWLFEKTADYGWGIGRSLTWWFCHWMFFATILFTNALPSINGANWWGFVLASIGTGFSNAHAFLFLTASGGYLEESRNLLESNDAWFLFLIKAAGVIEAVLGPIFLFLLLLTIQKRFRLA